MFSVEPTSHEFWLNITSDNSLDVWKETESVVQIFWVLWKKVTVSHFQFVIVLDSPWYFGDSEQSCAKKGKLYVRGNWRK